MYRGMGDDSTTDLSSVSGAITGAGAPTCDAGYSYSAALGVCVANSGICPSGYTFNAVSGVCEQGSGSGFTAWLTAGNNGAYAALAAVAAVVVFGMMAKR